MGNVASNREKRLAERIVTTARLTIATLVVASLATTFAAAAKLAVVPAARDNTLIENADGALSNGAGPGLYSGRIGAPRDSLRRAVIAFDVADHLPPKARIRSAALLLHLDRAGGDSVPDVALHRVLADWGEGTSFSPGGRGAAASPGDATWLHTFWDGLFWGTPGGDFDPAASAVTTVDRPGWYVWGPTPGLASDVQRWLDDPSEDHGWILIGDETAPSTVKAFDSRDVDDATVRPVLVIEYTGGGPDPEAGAVINFGRTGRDTGEAAALRQLIDELTKRTAASHAF